MRRARLSIDPEVALDVLDRLELSCLVVRGLDSSDSGHVALGDRCFAWRREGAVVTVEEKNDLAASSA